MAQKLIHSNSPINPNTISLNAASYYENNLKINLESTFKDFFLMQNNTERKKEYNYSDKNLIILYKK